MRLQIILDSAGIIDARSPGKPATGRPLDGGFETWQACDARLRLEMNIRRMGAGGQP
jgi:hypothetical protein